MEKVLTGGNTVVSVWRAGCTALVRSRRTASSLLPVPRRFFCLAIVVFFTSPWCSSLVLTLSLSSSSVAPSSHSSFLLFPIPLLVFQPSGNAEGWLAASTACKGKLGQIEQGIRTRAHTSGGQGDGAEALAARAPG